MPWDIKKSEGKFCIFKTEDNTKVHCHSTRGEAVAQLRALYASESEKTYAATPVTFNMGDVEGALYHLHALKALHDGINAGTTPLTDEVKEEFDRHIEEAIEALEGTDVEEPDYEDEPMIHDEPDMTYKADVEEFAWEGPIAFEGVFTGDKRVFAAGSIEWEAETLPWPFRWQKASVGGHAGAVPIGRVDRIERKDDGTIYGYGVVIPSLNEEAAEYLRLLESGVAGGVSVDGDSATFDVIEGATPEENRVEFSSMRLRSLTAVDVPAFNNAQIELCARMPHDLKDVDVQVELAKKRKKKSQSTRGAMTWQYQEGDTLTAAAVPVKPPISWFEDPHFDGPTPITVTPDGQVFGHLALFNSCHIGFPGQCVKPPKNNTYQYFHTGEIETAEGDAVEVGKLTFNTGHASMQDSAKAAAAHYDHTGAVAADVRAGEDQFGIWVAGGIRPHLSDEDIRTFRSAPLSGDWRRIAGRLELVGALAVNTPGFPVPRRKVLVASGETETFIAYQDEVDEDDRQTRLEKKAELASNLPPALVAQIVKKLKEDLAKETDPAKKKELEAKLAKYGEKVEEDKEEMSAETTIELAVTKSEGEEGDFPASDYAYVPDPESPSTWKLRLTSTPGGDPDPRIVGAAVAALGKGFRGNKVQLPAEDRPKVIAKVRAAWLKANEDKAEEDLPPVLKG